MVRYKMIIAMLLGLAAALPAKAQAPSKGQVPVIVDNLVYTNLDFCARRSKCVPMSLRDLQKASQEKQLYMYPLDSAALPIKWSSKCTDGSHPDELFSFGPQSLIPVDRIVLTHYVEGPAEGRIDSSYFLVYLKGETNDQKPIYFYEKDPGQWHYAPFPYTRRQQEQYSWEVVSADPGFVAQAGRMPPFSITAACPEDEKQSAITHNNTFVPMQPDTRAAGSGRYTSFPMVLVLID